ncbi:unnamed protein product [Mytilus edulis]|uniref:Uncharacterized protein n=1 Tax=Mytilus edulis TaxID=6550 RepID=A0A8S3SBI3_MYTED|nr:unnamed protein product [Mytilus edulis]
MLNYKSCILEHTTGDTSRLQIHCSQYLTTTPGKNMTKYNESVSENVNVRIPVIIAAVLGWCLTALFAITTLCLYRQYLNLYSIVDNALNIKLDNNIQNVHLQTVPDPCPDVARSRTIADMCTTDYATEEDQNGGLTVDSVELRVMNHHDGCKCESKLNNQKNTYTIYMRKYDLRKNAAPEKRYVDLQLI